MFCTYILKWEKKYYVGYTWDIDRRIKEHKNKSNVKYTSKIGNVELLGYFQYETKTEAIIQEKKIKKSWHIVKYTSYDWFIKYMGY